MNTQIVRFYRQYFQQLNELSYPPSVLLIKPLVQDEIFTYMFNEAKVPNLPPPRFRRRVLKALLQRIESAWQDPDEDEISNELMEQMARLTTVQDLPPVDAAQQKSVVSYFLPADDGQEAQPILIAEARNLLAVSSTTGLRTWDASLHLATYFCTAGRHLVQNRSILELGAGTGFLSTLCAGPLQARHVLATDGDASVVASIDDNAELNNDRLASRSRLEARRLDWTEHVSLPEVLATTRMDGKLDLIIGTDITYSYALMEPLVATFDALHKYSPGVNILISAVIRNEPTFTAFTKACSMKEFLVSNVHFDCPSTELQKGCFHKNFPPIRIVSVAKKSTTLK